jgi:hypothetical protein
VPHAILINIFRAVWCGQWFATPSAFDRRGMIRARLHSKKLGRADLRALSWISNL